MTKIIRAHDRRTDALRPIRFETGINLWAEGSCLVSYGNTKVICTASVETSVPPFLKNSGKGWVTAEYAMLPRATDTRNKRERERMTGRSHEIQRLIGRSLRAVVDMKLLGERSIMIDCDVIQADGGTRTASISGGYVAMAIAIRKLQAGGEIKGQNDPLLDQVAAVSVGVRGGQHFLDLDFQEDSACDVDMNLVMTGAGKFIELQGTAEHGSFDDNDLMLMTTIGRAGLKEIMELQRESLEKACAGIC